MLLLLDALTVPRPVIDQVAATNLTAGKHSLCRAQTVNSLPSFLIVASLSFRQ